MSAPVRDLVFVSYSHRGPEWRDRLLILLKPFVRQGRLQVWADPYIEAGSLWRREIDAALERTAVGVILLTSDVLASDFVADVEIPRLLRAARAGLLTLVVVPIQSHAEGATTFADGDLRDFQWPWPADQPVEGLDENKRNGALVTVINAIARGRRSIHGRPTGGHSRTDGPRAHRSRGTACSGPWHSCASSALPQTESGA